MQSKLIKKTIYQGIITILAFLLFWFALTNIDWLHLAKIQEISAETEQRIGDIIWDAQSLSETEITDSRITKPIDSILSHICQANAIDKSKIKIHVFDNNEVNAYALLNGHIVINTGLITNTDNSNELTGVICHELAHIEHKHVVTKLVREIGFNLLVSATTNNLEIIKKSIKVLSASAFDRKQEKIADLQAVDYLIAAGIEPQSFANFMNKRANDQGKTNLDLTWVNTHPAPKERYDYIIEYSKNKPKNQQKIINNSTWSILQEIINDKMQTKMEI